jgi:hypothetical protein
MDEAYPAIENTADYVWRPIPDAGPTAALVTNLSGGSGAVSVRDRRLARTRAVRLILKLREAP